MIESDSIPLSSKVDIVIFGGGIAGLWLLNILNSRGYNVILLEANSLGAGQSIASQGIIHGGLKYALNGALTGAAKAIAEMPAYWRNCYDGKGDINLSECNILSDQYYMWSDSGMRSRLKTFFGSKSLRGRIDRLDSSQYPAFFKGSSNPGSLYQLPDFVVDAGSLISALSIPLQNRIFRVDPSKITFNFDNMNNINSLLIASPEGEHAIEPQQFIFTAGEGNQGLMQKAGLRSPQMQVRPLNMVVARSLSLPLVYAHCIGDNFSLTPVLTLTSHKCENGDIAWYLGGELAEAGVGKNSEQQIKDAKVLLSKLFPWLDLADARWACLNINRAEGKVGDEHRPDSSFAHSESRVTVAWPTKFTLSPALAELVLNRLEAQNVVPKFTGIPEFLGNSYKTPAIAKPPWESLFENT